MSSEFPFISKNVKSYTPIFNLSWKDLIDTNNEECFECQEDISDPLTQEDCSEYRKLQIDSEAPESEAEISASPPRKVSKSLDQEALLSSAKT
ncbi:hypothetical protein O181_065868 [Austropuccinia psidii MF-1]|uniref:Uncharacterized protein n=1 Tax=Austropuccinia psidii MF-1 TaxID=1389203 RepID=A0A9Q3EW38_9BASI|nr:hypothetical protein [Austropuccinia psidii MF-1]